MNAKPSGIGLVLSGGGAKGAYQVGVIKALAHLDVPIDLVAGASIGALNGAMVSVSRDLHLAANRLEKLWTQLGESSPLQLNANYLTFLAVWGGTVGVRLTPVGLALAVGASAASKVLAQSGRGEASFEASLSKLGPIQKILEDNITPEALAAGLGLHVSVFPADQVLSDVLGYLKSAAGISDNRDSEFLHVQSLPADQRLKAILASAALPLIFEAQQVEGRSYRDGGMGGNQRVQGNTPADPLVKAGCDRLIVTHLSDGSLWSRSRYPGTTIIEIRPARTMQRNAMPGLDMVSFDPKVIRMRMQEGYDDTIASLEPILEALRVRAMRQVSADHRDRSVGRAADAVKDLDDDGFSKRFGH